MKNKYEWGFFQDVGLVAWGCFLSGALVVSFSDWNVFPLEKILGLVALLYGWNRIEQVFDKREIIEEIKEMKKKK